MGLCVCSPECLLPFGDKRVVEGSRMEDGARRFPKDLRGEGDHLE